MRTKKLFFIWSLFLLCNVQLVIGQNGFEISGKVVEAGQLSPIEFATVMIMDSTTQQPLAGATTNESGIFSLRTEKEGIHIQVGFIGYDTRIVKDISVSDGVADLGTIALSETQVTLDDVVIEGERSQMEFRLDKRIFNVGKDLSSTGASALEVLNNVPSVNVSIEGQISLRGSQGVQILINGKPSVLANEQGSLLGTITADMIERIELITNPSAKYEAEGTSGIINIVLKKDERKGVNGSFTLNTGLPHNHSFGLSLNRRTEKFNLFSQLGAGYREIPSDVENINQNLSSNTTLTSVGEEFRNENFYNIILGTDYYLNPRNVLTLSGNFAYEIEDQPSNTDFVFLDESGEIVSQWNRTETTQATNPKWQYEFQYKRDFEDHKDHTLLFSALGNFFGKDQSSEFVNIATSGDPVSDIQQTRTNFKESKFTFQLDYTHPVSDKITFETGAMYVINNVSNDFAVSNLVNAEWVTDSGLTNVFEYDQNVLGVYGTGAYEAGKWGVKLGMRVENTLLNTLLRNTDEANDQNFTNFFPSGHASYKFSERVSIQAGYSRRIYRPRLWDLNPFFNIRNNFSIRAGNPNLLPEFTDSYELTSIYVLNKASFNLGLFHRFTQDVIERVSFFENDVNTVKPVNLGTNRATGIELNGKYSPFTWMTFNGDLNFLYFNRQGTFESTVFDFSAKQWSAKLTAKFKLPLQTDFELTGQYLSKVQTVQGETSQNLFADMGLRKKLFKSKGVINFSIRDIFASRIRESQAFQPGFYLYNRSQRGRFVTMGFSYGFGKGEAMEFSGSRRFY